MFSEKDLIYPVSDQRLDTLFSGRFARRVLILLQAEKEPSTAEIFLNKVLAAVQINLEQDTYFATLHSKNPAGIASTLQNKQPEKILVFGLAPESLSLAIQAPPYQPFEFYASTWLFADPLSQIEADKNLKTRLWRALQQVFELRS